MKIQIVMDIAPNSTRDVADGLRDALRQLGHEVHAIPVHSLAVHLFKPFGSIHPDEVPVEVRKLYWGIVNDFILAQAVKFKPDAIIVVSGWVINRYTLDEIRALPCNPTLALYLTESPYQDSEQATHNAFGAYDVVFCNERGSMDFMRQQHDNVAYLPHSFNPEVHRPVPGAVPDCDVYMCGTGFTERIDILRAVNWDGIRCKLEGFWEGAVGDREIRGVEIVKDTVENESLPVIYSNVPINLNIHRTTKTWLGGTDDEQHIDYAESIGPRVYEVLACGGFLVTDHRAEMQDCGLRDGRELVVYADAHDLEEKVRWYLQHTDARQRIAEYGRAAIALCTFKNRCEKIILPNLTKKGVLIYG